MTHLPEHPQAGHAQDALASYLAAVGRLHRKLGTIAAHNHQTCGHLSRAASALRAMAAHRTEGRRTAQERLK